jgi:hypothetical protein
MHNSLDGQRVGPGSSTWLLKQTDPSSICLNCHAGAGSPNSWHVASADGSALTPGGDFYWLTKTFTWLGGSSPGDRHGHNIIAQDYGFVQDALLNQAPGGTYQSADLGCTSCHDPHGQVGGSNLPISDSGSYGGIPRAGTILGNYRLLGESGYDGGEHVQGFSFINGVPVARQNAAVKYGETDASHVDYGSDMSEWCANCHGDMLTREHQTSGNFEHPAGNNEKIESQMVDNYNAYVKTGDLSGTAATAYLQFVPFERGITDASSLDPTSPQGPDRNSNIMCLTCHRAHASAFQAIGRWDFYTGADLLANSHPAPGDVGATANDVLFSYYGRDIVVEFGVGQRVFCEKCHDVSGFNKR